MTQGKTICECGRDDIHSSKDCWAIENWIKNSRNMTKEEADGLDEFCWGELDRTKITVNSEDVKYTLNANQLHYISFHNKEYKEIGKLNFDTDKLVFEGNVEQSAKNFMDYLLMVFNNKIDTLTMDAYYRGWKDSRN